ncbi:hypothetical protein C2W64_04083 [Brevibacillus laterosporus]|nr:hypothetical protein [Brevibacillus laterosporus]RAP29136.1 hypothetical protein C2W64_04083 [Brevibacillus laterosporus]
MTEQQIIVTLATKVMGWKRYQETDFWFGYNGNLFNSSLWNPLQNIADAWMIMEEMRKRQYYLVISPCFIGYEVYPQRVNGSRICEEVYAKTVQEAICNAAMRLVGKEKHDGETAK